MRALRRETIWKVAIFNLIALLLLVYLVYLMRPLPYPELWVSPGKITSVDPHIDVTPLQPGVDKKETNLYMTFVKEAQIRSRWEKFSLGRKGFEKRAEVKSYSMPSASDFTERDLNQLGNALIPYMKHDIIKAAMVYKGIEWNEQITKPIVVYHPEKFKTGADLLEEDEILSINEDSIDSAEDVSSVLKKYGVGDTVQVLLKREGKEVVLPILLKELERSGSATLGVYLKNKFTFDGLDENRILHLEDNYSGESGGFMLALGMIQMLQPDKDFSRGRIVAGTGGITRGGYIKEIGNLDLKIKTAAQDNADIFFYPKTQNDIAQLAIKKYNITKMNMVPVLRLEEAINYLEQ
jgi:PDZ domain-containing protein